MQLLRRLPPGNGGSIVEKILRTVAMNPERFRQIEELYHSAWEREPNERGAFLAQACPGDEELRREVESLLAQDSPGGPPSGLMARPAMEVAANLLREETVTLLGVGAQLGPYRIEAPLGAGGMGEVYRARDTRLRRTVAIKISQRRFTGRFESEARAVAALNHPNIVQVYGMSARLQVPGKWGSVPLPSGCGSGWATFQKRRFSCP